MFSQGLAGIIFIAFPALGGPWRVPGESLGVPARSLPGGSRWVPGRPWDVFGRIEVVPGGRCFYHRPLCPSYCGKYDVSVVPLGAPRVIDEVEVFTKPGDFGPPTDPVNSI